jgi:hypothetical protein
MTIKSNVKTGIVFKEAIHAERTRFSCSTFKELLLSGIYMGYPYLPQKKATKPLRVF